MNPNFDQYLKEALESLPAKLRLAIGNVAIVVEELPREATFNEVQIKKGSILLGLYQGVPQNKWGRSGSGIPPDKITIFQNNIEQIAGSSDEKLKNVVKDVVWHEIGHHFGFNEEEIRKIEERRKK